MGFGITTGGGLLLTRYGTCGLQNLSNCQLLWKEWSQWPVFEDYVRETEE
jgi:hypothetical protein